MRELVGLLAGALLAGELGLTVLAIDAALSRIKAAQPARGPTPAAPTAGMLDKVYDPKGGTNRYVGDGARSSTNVPPEMIADRKDVECSNDNLAESVIGLFTHVFNNLPNVAIVLR